MQVITTGEVSSSDDFFDHDNESSWEKNCSEWPDGKATEPYGPDGLGGHSFADWGINLGVCAIDVHQIELCPLWRNHAPTTFKCYRSAYNHAGHGTLRNAWEADEGFTPLALDGFSPTSSDDLFTNEEFMDRCSGSYVFSGEPTWSVGGEYDDLIARIGFKIEGGGDGGGSSSDFYFGVGLAQDGGAPAYGIAKGTGSSFSSCPVHWSVRVR